MHLKAEMRRAGAWDAKCDVAVKFNSVRRTQFWCRHQSPLKEASNSGG